MSTSRRSDRTGLLTIATLIGVFSSTIPAAAAPAASGWQAGAASVDITPAKPVWMAGYASRKSPSEGVTIPIRAKALALRDAEGHTTLWITADLVGFDRPLMTILKDRIVSKHGLPRDAIALFASHTHTGPAIKNVARTLAEVGRDTALARANTEYRLTLEDRLVGLADAALAALAPADLAFGAGQAPFALNRREKQPDGTFRIGKNPTGPTDKSVPVLRVTGPDGALRAVVFGYACHNTTLTDKIMTLSGDYAGFAQAAIEEAHPGSVALFVTGCAGDANPEPRGTVELGRQHGRELADAVEAVLGKPTGLTSLSGALRAAAAEPLVQFAGPTDRASYVKRLKEPNTARQAHAKRMIAQIDAGKSIESTYPYPIQAFALGDQLVVVTLAGEVVVDYSLRLKKELTRPGRNVWVAAYANDVFGYVPSARVLAEGGYEGGEAFYYSTFPTPFTTDIEETIVKAAHEVVDRVSPTK